MAAGPRTGRRTIRHGQSTVGREDGGNPGVLVYDWFVSEHGHTAHIYGRPANNTAVMTRISGFRSKVTERLFTVRKPARLQILGNVRDDVQQTMAGLVLAHLPLIGGVAR